MICWWLEINLQLGRGTARRWLLDALFFRSWAWHPKNPPKLSCATRDHSTTTRNGHAKRGCCRFIASDAQKSDLDETLGSASYLSHAAKYTDDRFSMIQAQAQVKYVSCHASSISGDCPVSTGSSARQDLYPIHDFSSNRTPFSATASNLATGRPGVQEKRSVFQTLGSPPRLK